MLNFYGSFFTLILIWPPVQVGIQPQMLTTKQTVISALVLSAVANRVRHLEPVVHNRCLLCWWCQSPTGSRRSLPELLTVWILVISYITVCQLVVLLEHLLTVSQSSTFEPPRHLRRWVTTGTTDDQCVGVDSKALLWRSVIKRYLLYTTNICITASFLQQQT